MNVVSPKHFSVPLSSPEDRSLLRKATTTISDKITLLASRIAQPLTFPGASIHLKNPERLKKTEDELLTLGGEALALHTEDGEELEAMYFDVDEVVKSLGGGQNPRVYGAYHVFSQRFFRFLSIPSIENNIMLRENHDWDHQGQEIITSLEGWSASIKNFLAHFRLCSPAVERKHEFLFALGEAQFRDPTKNIVNGQRPTVILCPGGGCTYQMLKKVLIPAYLKRGINVMAVNYRGYGNSTGRTTEKGMITDIETAYQFVSQVKQIPNERMIVHGHCLGSVPATALAEKHEGVNLVLDRPIANYKMALKDSLTKNLELFKERVTEKRSPKLKPIIAKTLDVSGGAFINVAAFFSKLLGSFDNLSRIDKVKGSVAIIQSEYDEVLSSKHSELLAKKVSAEAKERGFQYIVCNKGHSDAWTDEKALGEKTADDYFDEFLQKTGLLGSLI